MNKQTRVQGSEFRAQNLRTTRRPGFLIYAAALILAGALSARADVSDPGNMTLGQNAVIGGTATVQGNAFSVGGSTLVVAGGNVGVSSASPQGLFVVGNGTMVVTSLGRVGIGMTNPLSVLQTYGALKVGGNAGQGVGQIALGDDQSTSQNVGIWRGLENSLSGGNWLNLGGYQGITFNTGNNSIGSQNERVTITVNGNVGIGTANPAASLQVSGGNIETDGGYGIIGSPSGSIVTPNDGVIGAKVYAGSTGSIRFGQGSTELVRIVNNGNVGIGKTNPGTLLDVAGTITGTAKNFRIEHPNDPKKLLIHADVEAPEYGLIYRGSGKLTDGVANIELPDYFESLTSTGARTVQLTCQHGWSPLYYDDVTNGHFTVHTTGQGDQNQEFSWTVYARRNDSYVKKYPLTVVKDKPTEKIGKTRWNAMTDDEKQIHQWNSIVELVPDDGKTTRN